MNPVSTTDPMAFRRFGRTYHLNITTADDLRHALSLDEALWVATSAPTNTLNTDEVFLKLLDTDGDGRVRVYEMKQAIGWTLDVLQVTDGLEQASDTLNFVDVNAEHEDGQRIITAAKKVLSRLELGKADCVTLDQVRQVMALEADRAVSEAGVVLPEAATTENIRQFIDDILMTVGGTPHPSGHNGVTADKLGEFLTQAQGLLDWQQRGQLPEGQQTSDIHPFGNDTAAMFATLEKIRAKVDQYFAQCRAVAQDASLAARFGESAEQLSQRDLNDPAQIQAVLLEAPLSPPTAERVLRFDRPINPAYTDSVEQLRSQLIGPILGGDMTAIDESQWQQVVDKFAAYRRWIAGKVGQQVESLGVERLQRYLEPQYAAAVHDLIEQSRATSIVMDNLRLVEKLALYQTHLMRLANNFISFPDLYRPDHVAMFDMGNLVMDGRRFNLAVRVFDRAEHVRVAQTSNMYVLYLQIFAPGAKTYEVAVPVTSGGQGNLCVGKRGIFDDVSGKELDARVVQVIENPISLKEAMISPFKRLGKAIAGKIESIASAAEKKLDATGGQLVTDIQQAPSTTASAATPAPAPTTAPQQAAPSGGAQMGGLLAGGGIAIAALGSSLAFITKTLAGLKWYTVLGGLAGAIVAVVLPTVIVAWMKLRSRDLSAILEGSGWAINARMRLTRRQSRYFTFKPPYPDEATGIRYRRWLWIIVAAVAITALGVAGYAVWGPGKNAEKNVPQPAPLKLPNPVLPDAPATP